MQVNRSPSRAPYVAALVCLFVLCLIVPVYWQSTQAPRELLEPVGPQSAADDVSDGNLYRFGNFGPHALGYGGDPSLEDLLRDLANRQQVRAADDDLFTQLLTVRGETASAPPELAYLPRFVTDVFNRAGHEMARRPSMDISPVVARFLRTAPGTGVPPRRTSRFARGTRDSLVIVPPYAPSYDVEAFGTPWCSPLMLLERLEVLAANPYTSDWARETIDQLRPLTENSELRSDEVAVRLLRLNSLAAGAVELASRTNDDRVRAELLRAHWGLARRIDCWALMRDIVVASAAANRFAARAPWESPDHSFSRQGTKPVDLRALSADLENYEQARSPKLARAIIERQRLLAAADDTRSRELADEIEQNYRNANVRLAVSSEMLGRFVPQQSSQVAPVRDRIAGTPVRGTSQTFTENRLRLQPDDDRWFMGLESQGTVESRTVADGGQARVRSRSTTQFSAEKEIVVEVNGVHLGTSSADALTCSQLIGVESSFDWMPIVNEVLRERAIKEYRAKRPRAAAEVEYKVARRVETQLDHRAGEAVERMEQQFRDQVTGPLEHAGVVWTPIQLSTTADRLIARLRVAGDDQLAGHTPRPQAPSDSFASLQVHESALTNAARSLRLDGQRYTAPELQALLRDKFSTASQPATLEVESDTVFEFANQDAVRTRIADERLEVILSLAAVDYEGDAVRDFRVHAFYRPVIQGVEAEFVRDGALGIEGRLRTGERARMHGVFNKVLSEERRLPIVRLTNPSDERFNALMITQLVLEDGWMGLALGPEHSGRTAERSRMLR